MSIIGISTRQSISLLTGICGISCRHSPAMPGIRNLALWGMGRNLDALSLSVYYIKSCQHARCCRVLPREGLVK